MLDSEESDLKTDLMEIKEEIEKRKRDPSTASNFFSGWDDTDGEVDLVKNPKESPKEYILWAAEHGELDTVKVLLTKDPTLVNVRDSDGYTPLHRAAYGDHVEVISSLLKHGADISARTEMGWTPLHSAANWNNYRSCARLIHGGANVNALTDGSQTPLHLASAISHSRSTLLLLLAHPDIIHDRVNASGQTPHQLASAKGHYAPLFHMADPTVTFIKSRAFTDNPFFRPHDPS